MKQLNHHEILINAFKKMTLYSIIHSKEMFPQYTGEKPLHERLNEIKLPTLILFGTDDRIVTDKGLAHD